MTTRTRTLKQYIQQAGQQAKAAECERAIDLLRTIYPDPTVPTDSADPADPADPNHPNQ